MADDLEVHKSVPGFCLSNTHLPQARLESHAQAFEGLLSLIPANEYYSKDNSVCPSLHSCPKHTLLTLFSAGPMAAQEADQRAEAPSKARKTRPCKPKIRKGCHG
jgi:hypothetical protein